MKEPTIEQKAKRFDEVLAMAKECITYVPDDAVNKYMLNMFPELKESEDEDEKTRKELIELIGCMHDADPRKKGWLAWLEKQGEKKPTDEEMKELLRTEYEKGKADAIAETQVAWSEEDERILYNVKAYIGYAAGQRGVKDELFKEANEWLNSLPIGFIYNKNYNEDMVTLLVNELKQIANDNNAPKQYQVEINWLKSLKPQPKQEWSEEDEKMLNRLIGVLDGTNKEDYHEGWEEIFLPWLKSLKQRYNWKPVKSRWMPWIQHFSIVKCHTIHMSTLIHCIMT